MAMKRTLLVEISTTHPFSDDYIYTGVNLPASQSRIEDALQKARAIARDDYIFYKVSNCKVIPLLSDVKLESPKIDELNYFAYRLTQLNDSEKLAINAIFKNRYNDGKYDEVGISMKELINLTYGLEAVPVISGVDTAEKVGQFVIDNDLDDAVIGLSDESFKLLDKKLVGERFMDAEGGVIVDGSYVSTGNYTDAQMYDGENLPELPPEYGKGTIMLLVAKQPQNDVSEVEENARWIGLPINMNEADKIADELGETSIEDCVYLNMESNLSYVDDEVFIDMEDFEELNKLCEGYEELPELDKVKFKAILAKERPETVAEAREYLTRIDNYDFAYFANTESNLGYEYMSNKLPTDFDMSLLEDCFGHVGYALYTKRGISVTDYGSIAKEGEMIFGNVGKSLSQEDEHEEFEDEDIEMGGMQL